MEAEHRIERYVVPHAHRLNMHMGSNQVLRSKVDRLENEQREVQQRLRPSGGYGGSGGAPSGRSSGGNPLLEFQLAEQTRQLEKLQQQLAFQEQEVRLPSPAASREPPYLSMCQSSWPGV